MDFMAMSLHAFSLCPFSPIVWDDVHMPLIRKVVVQKRAIPQNEMSAIACRRRLLTGTNLNTAHKLEQLRLQYIIQCFKKSQEGWIERLTPDFVCEIS